MRTTSDGDGLQEELDLVHVEEALDAVQANVSLNRPVGFEEDGELGDLFEDESAASPVMPSAESIASAKASAYSWFGPPSPSPRIVTVNSPPERKIARRP